MLTKPISTNIPIGNAKFSSKLDASSNADAVVTLAAQADSVVVVTRLLWSYSGTPVGKITISGGLTTLEFDITAGGPGSLPIAYIGVKNTNVVITLAAGGSGVTGKLNSNWYYDR